MGGSLIMWWMAAQNANAGNRSLELAGPIARVTIQPLKGNARQVLHYAAEEQYRSLEPSWETAQIAAGSLFFLMMLFGSREHKVLLGGILLTVLLVCAERFFVTGELIAVGRMADFAPAGSPQQNQLSVVQSLFWGVEAAKFGLALVLTGMMVFSTKRSGRSRNARREMNFVDKADYRSVNR